MKIITPILGGGLVGRIAGVMLDGIILEASEQPIPRLDRGVFYLHVTSGMKVFLKTLNLSIDTVPIKTGIVWWKYPESFLDMDAHQIKSSIEAYCMKTRKASYSSLPEDERNSIMDYIRSRNQPLRFAVSAMELWNALVEYTDKQTLYGVKVKEISNGLLDTSEGDIYFNTAINTLPLSLWAGYASGLRTTGSNTFRFRVGEILFEEYDFLYLPSSDYAATRISFPYHLDDKIDKYEVWLETSGNSESAYKDLINLGYNDPSFISHTYNGFKQLKGKPELYIEKLKSYGVISLGRYAMWDNSLTISDIAWEVMNLGGYNPNVQETTD